MNHILIVDDSDADALLVQTILQRHNDTYRFSRARTGAECLELLSQPPDILLLDVRLPDTDGVSLCRQLHYDPAFKHIPVILITGMDSIEDKITGFKAGAVDYIVKPFNGQEVQLRVAAQLNLKQYRDELKTAHEKLKQAQDALISNARMSAVGSLAAGITHEFNNLLGMMGGYVQLGMEKHDVNELQETLCMLQTLVGRGEQLVQGLLGLVRSGKARGRAKVELKELIEQTLGLMKKKLTDNEVSVEILSKELPLVPCSPGEISQVIINLVKNAVEAMRESAQKRIVISIERLPQDHDWIALRIRDTGPGMPDHVRERIFDPFYTTKGVIAGGDDNTPGTGLGLSIVFSIVQSHQGRISVESAVGHGTTFCLELPLSEREPAPNGPARAAGPLI